MIPDPKQYGWVPGNGRCHLLVPGNIAGTHVRAGFSWLEAWGPTKGVSLVWKVGGPSLRHQKCRGLRCWRHQVGREMGRGHPSEPTRGGASGAVVELYHNL